MDEEYSFQPQINTRSRRLARDAPTLRERQEQELLRHSARCECPAQSRPARSPVSASKTVARAPTAKPSIVAKNDDNAVSDDDTVVQSVWALWRAAAAGEGRAAELQYVRAETVADGAALPRPPVVYVATVLSMLTSLGLRAPQHAALVDKFLMALDIQGAGEETAVVDAERFVYVFTTVWKAAITNPTRVGPALARSCVSRGVSPVVQPAQRFSCSPSSPSISPQVARRGPSTSDAAASSNVNSSGAATPRSTSSLSSSAVSQCHARGSSVVGKTVVLHTSFEPHASLTESASRESSSLDESADNSSSGSGTHVGVDEVSSEDGSFLHTNMSRTSSLSPPTPQAEAKPASSPSPFSAEDAPGLSPSPEPRNPHETPAARTTSRPTAHRSPFSTTPAPLRSASSAASMMKRVPHAGSATRVLASDSHLLTSTVSRESKKAAKRVPGGPMRECTFAPKINDVSQELRHASVTAAENRRKVEHVDATPSFQPNTQQYHKERAKLAWWAEKPFKRSVYTSNEDLHRSAQHEPAAGVGGATPVPMAPGFDTAVRRMIAARQRQQQHGPSTSDMYTPAPSKRESAVRRTEAQPLLYVDVDLPRGETGRIALFRGADVAEVAKDFSATHNLDDRLCRRLENVLREQLLAFT